MAYQKYYGFHYDAFVQNTEFNGTDSETARSPCGIMILMPRLNFRRQSTYRLTTSMPLDGVDSTQADLPDIKIGSTMPLNRGIAIMGQRVKRGMDIE